MYNDGYIYKHMYVYIVYIVYITTLGIGIVRGTANLSLIQSRSLLALSLSVAASFKRSTLPVPACLPDSSCSA